MFSTSFTMNIYQHLSLLMDRQVRFEYYPVTVKRAHSHACTCMHTRTHPQTSRNINIHRKTKQNPQTYKSPRTTQLHIQN